MSAVLAEQTRRALGRRRTGALVAEIEAPYDLPDADEPADEIDDASELDDIDGASIDDANWDVFVADDDERDPLPDPGDFWMGE